MHKPQTHNNDRTTTYHLKDANTQHNTIKQQQLLTPTTDYPRRHTNQMTEEWEIILSKPLEDGPSRLSLKQWRPQLLRRIWLIAWELWEHRNDRKHNHTDTEFQLAKNTREFQRIREAPTLGYHPQELLLITTSPHKFKTLTLHQQDQWLTRARNFLNNRNRREEVAYSQERRGLRRWLTGRAP